MPFFPDPVTKNDASPVCSRVLISNSNFVTASRFLSIIICNYYIILSGLVILLFLIVIFNTL